jgi:hypothetical protein
MSFRDGLVALRTAAYYTTHRVRIIPDWLDGRKSWHNTAEA